MIYLKTNGNGNHTEGIGALAQYQLYTYALAKMFDCGYTFDGFKNLQHYQYNNVSQEKFSDDASSFFNFVSDKAEGSFDRVRNFDALRGYMSQQENLILELDWCCFGQIMNSSGIIREIEDRGLIEHLQLSFDTQQSYFNPGKPKVAIHIRKFTGTDCDRNPVREVFAEYRKDFYLNLIRGISDMIDAEFHIYSQGRVSDYNFLNGPNVVMHIEEYPIISLYHMIHSDVLVMANSSFSYIAHLLGHPITLVRTNFYHQTYNRGRVWLAGDGNFNKNQFEEALKCLRPEILMK